MSLLTPLYLLGALAVAAPILFHLIRRSPRGEVPFSSLMFLSPTPPRLTRRSRLDDWFLLLLRAAALCLLAFAFARPFLREPALRDAGEGERRRVVVLVDSSASMRRGDLWEQAKRLAAEAIDGSRPGDRLAVYAFDTATRPLLGFTESATLDPARLKAVAKFRLERLTPTWRATDLGQALIDAVGAVEDVTDRSAKVGRMPRRIVLVTDLQEGSRLDALGLFEWPSDVELELRTVSDDRPNATLQRVADAPDSASGDATDSLRIRVSNAADSDRERFRLVWKGVKGKPIEAYVPAGRSRVVRVPRPAGDSLGRSLQLSGDAHEFDNTLFIADEPVRESTVLFIGDDRADDPSGLLYYLDRVFHDAAGQTVDVRRTPSDAAVEPEPVGAMPLVILTDETTPENVKRLKRYAADGGTVLCVLRSPVQAGTLAALTDLPIQDVREASVEGDVMLGEIDFGHPLFAPLAGPQYNDFTKIRFWKYRRLDEATLGDAAVVARFENRDPAIVERAVGKGRVVAMASGWNPADSQLARSSKFVPLITALTERRGERKFDATDLLVGAPLPLPTSAEGETTVQTPGGETVTPESGETAFAATDEPGIYTIASPEGPRLYAVNLDPAEGKTAPLPVETLERFGCRMAGDEPDAAAAALQRRQLLNAELEGRQKLWRWLVLAAVGVLIVETWLAGRAARTGPAREEALAS